MESSPRVSTQCLIVSDLRLAISNTTPIPRLHWHLRRTHRRGNRNRRLTFLVRFTPHVLEIRQRALRLFPPRFAATLLALTLSANRRRPHHRGSQQTSSN